MYSDDDNFLWSFLNHSKNIGVDPDEIEHGNIYDAFIESRISDMGNSFKIGLAKRKLKSD